MKKIIDYKREWEQLALSTEKEYLAPMELYVVMNFLNDIGAPEPWKKEDQEKIQKAGAELSEHEREEFTRLFEEARSMIDNMKKPETEN